MKTTVIIQISIEGFHQYNEAPEEVKFLSCIHRHTFIIKCGYKVTSLNRELEIFICRKAVNNYIESIYSIPALFNNMSCEMIAKDILTSHKKDKMIWCEVWEENTGGAKIEL